MQTQPNPGRLINYKSMRVVVGLIAILLAPVVWRLSGGPGVLRSISLAYWTDSRDIFVGALVAVGFFLSAYNGSGGKKDWEYYLSKASCLFAVIVAFFPTAGFASGHNEPARWILRICRLVGLEHNQIHYGSAVLLFLCLIAMMWFFSSRAMDKGKPGRAWVYRIIGIGMLAGGPAVFGICLLLHCRSAVYWVEFWELTLFGAGWLVAGGYRDKPPKE